jgi:hypothetical protein
MIYVLGVLAWLFCGLLPSIYIAIKQTYLSWAEFLACAVCGPLTFIPIIIPMLDDLGDKMMDLFDKLDSSYIWKKKVKNETSTPKSPTRL